MIKHSALQFPTQELTQHSNLCSRGETGSQPWSGQASQKQTQHLGLPTTTIPACTSGRNPEMGENTYKNCTDPPNFQNKHSRLLSVKRW